MTATEDRLRRRLTELTNQLLAAGVQPLAPADLPDDREIDRLLPLVWTRYPVLRSVNDEEYREAFVATLRYLNQARRRAEPDTNYMTAFWCGEVGSFLRRLGLATPTVTVAPFTAAAVVSHVAHAPLKRYPHDLAFGLALGDAPASTCWWREVLRTGRVPDPIEPPQQTFRGRPHEISVTFSGGNRHVGGRHDPW
jgi:hypothetical protein